jgi:long-chain acyl-CoA synthetase
MLFEPLFEHAQRTPDAVAITDDQGSYSYLQLATAAAGLGAYLSFQTNKPHVGVLLPAGAGFVASFYGTLLAGKAVVPINFLLADREIAHVIADSGIDTIITVPQLAARLKGLEVNIIDLAELIKMMPPPLEGTPPLPTPAPGDLAVLMYTSGTSGLPKGVELTYQNLQSDVDDSIRYARLETQHRFLGIIPLFHAFGMTAMMIAPIQLGAPVFYLARFSPVAALHAIREHKVSIMFGVPSMFAALLHLKNASAEDFKSIYAIITGGEPQPAMLRTQFLERFGVPLLEGYGLTETSPVIALNTPQVMRPGSVGKPLPSVEVRITDDDGNAQGVGQTGEIWLRGPMVMKGYYQLPEVTAAALTPDGFFKTGDLGQIDADGFLFITGRKKDLIIIAGEKVYPREVEDVLMRHSSVGEAAVVGKKDPSRGEVVVAFVSAREGMEIKADSLRDFCRSEGLTQWKCPREIIALPELPHSPTGKILKRVLAERLATSA